VADRRAIGRSGEDAATAWYIAQGWRVLARNWRCREGELDLVAERRGTVVFCEVKARSSTAFGLPAEAVTAAKQARLRRLAAMWLAQDGRDIRRHELRFDVATVLGGGAVEVVEAAF
jgi:putative endonuclease